MDLSQYKDLQYDSRKLKPGSIFLAIKGENHDAHSFIPQAIEAGASLIVYQENLYQPSDDEKAKTKFLAVKDTKQELAKLSAEFYGKPSEQLKTIGVTGTNGKTTVTHLLQVLLPTKTALLGTMGLKESPEAPYKDLGHTTPQAKELQEELKNLVDADFEYLTMEVSSHALDQSRVAEIKFKTAIITNLTQDHLDYHITMDKYFQAKAQIFKQTSELAVLNADDSYYQDFTEAAQGLKLMTYAVENEADLKAENINFNDRGLSYDLIYQGQSHKIELQLNGMFNVYNSLAAIAAALAEGIEIQTIADALRQTPPVAGRFELIKEGDSPRCIVDYAHSPDGLLNVLKGAKALIEDDQELICLFGCGGDRDITKRPQMGKIAYEHADFVFVTSDNPRSEDPEQIIADIMTGIPDLSKVKVISDRRNAIQEAVAKARPQDIVVIAGKGHEDYQILKNETIHFDDREELRKAIALSC